MSDFELLLREQTIQEWKDLGQIRPHDARASSRIMRTYHTHFGHAHRESAWLVGQSETRIQTNSAYISSTQYS